MTRKDERKAATDRHHAKRHDKRRQPEECGLPAELDSIVYSSLFGIPANVLFLIGLYICACGYLSYTKGGRTFFEQPTADSAHGLLAPGALVDDKIIASKLDLDIAQFDQCTRHKLGVAKVLIHENRSQTCDRRLDGQNCTERMGQVKSGISLKSAQGIPVGSR